MLTWSHWNRNHKTKKKAGKENRFLEKTKLLHINRASSSYIFCIFGKASDTDKRAIAELNSEEIFLVSNKQKWSNTNFVTKEKCIQQSQNYSVLVTVEKK